jgi:hypothetical protein
MKLFWTFLLAIAFCHSALAAVLPAHACCKSPGMHHGAMRTGWLFAEHTGAGSCCATTLSSICTHQRVCARRYCFRADGVARDLDAARLRNPYCRPSFNLKTLEYIMKRTLLKFSAALALLGASAAAVAANAGCCGSVECCLNMLACCFS